MSKTADRQTPQRCSECERIVVLTKKDTRQLVARCKCSERQIRVSKATPESWA